MIVPMPPETREALRLLTISRNLDVDRSQVRGQIEALADQLEERTAAKAAQP